MSSWSCRRHHQRPCVALPRTREYSRRWCYCSTCNIRVAVLPVSPGGDLIYSTGLVIYRGSKIHVLSSTADKACMVLYVTALVCMSNANKDCICIRKKGQLRQQWAVHQVMHCTLCNRHFKSVRDHMCPVRRISTVSPIESWKTIKDDGPICDGCGIQHFRT